MQGSGTFCVESVIGTALPAAGKLLVLPNGAYGDRMVQIARTLKIDCVANDSGEVDPPDLEKLEATLKADGAITHVAVVHSETTTGMLNPIEAIGKIVKKYGKVYIVDAMSSFGGIPIDVAALDIDFIVSSANKCIQGVPGFGFIIAKEESLVKCKGQARSLVARYVRPVEDHGRGQGEMALYLSDARRPRLPPGPQGTRRGGGDRQAGGALPEPTTGPSSTACGHSGSARSCPMPARAPSSPPSTARRSKRYDFKTFYDKLKARGFVIYPGKVSKASAFRIGTIGDVHPADMERLLKAIEASMFWKD